MDNFSANPFFWKRKFTKLDYLSFFLMVPYLPIKIGFILISFILFFVSSFILFKIKQIHKPVDYLKVREYYVTIPRFFLLMFFKAFGFRIQYIGDFKRSSDAKFYVFVPHRSFFDPFVLYSLKLNTVVSTAVIKKSPFYYFFILKGAIFLEKDKQKTIEAIKTATDSNDPVVIFAEGTLTNGQSVLKFKSGCFEPGLPLQLVYIEYPKGTENFTVRLCPNKNLDVLFFTLLKPRILIKAHILPVYYPSKEEIKNPVQFRENIRNYFCDRYCLRKSFYDSDDSYYLEILKNRKIPRSPTCLKLFKTVCKMIALTQNKSVSAVLNQNLNEDLDQNSNRIDDLEIFLMNFILSSIEKLNSLNKLELSIGSAKDLVAFLELDKKCPEIENTTALNALEDFIEITSGHSNDRTFLHLYIVFTLCNISIPLKIRINKCIMKLENIEMEQLNDHVISYSSFCKIIWHLLGIDESYLPESIFKNRQIKSDFFDEQIYQMFSLAVYQNVPDLIPMKN